MKCEELEILWNAWLDRPIGPSPALDLEAEAHRAVCASCRTRGAGFLALAASLKAPFDGPIPSADFADRVLRGVQAERMADVSRRTWRRWGILATAAALVLCSGVGFWLGRPDPSPDQPPRIALHQPARPSVRLTDALAEATSATIQLALESSAPAARLGRDVLGSTARVRPPSASLTDSIEATEVLEGAGRRLTSGVPPISHQAQRAFGFLLGPASTLVQSDPPARDGA